MSTATLQIELSRVARDPNQPRTHFDEASIQRLAKTISLYGQLVPAMVRPNPELDTSFLLVDGERRLTALEQLAQEGRGLKLWAVLDDAERDSSERLIRQYATNEQRAGHTPSEKIAVLQSLDGAVPDSEVPDVLGMTAGEYRLLKKLSKAEDWLLEFGRPGLKLPTPVIDEESGIPKRDASGRKTKTYLRAYEPLPLTHLDVLVTASNAIARIDRDQAAKSGKLKNLAFKTVTRLARQAVLEEWSARLLKSNVSRTIAALQRDDTKPKKKPAARASWSVAPLKTLSREEQIAALRAAIAELGIPAEALVSA